MNKTTKYFAISLLGIMLVLLFFSTFNDSGTMDELAHIPAGYSYLDQMDFRLNPEHPPLIKDLSAIPLLFLDLNFPTDVPPWTEYINGQWDMGRIFLYESGNNADRMLRFSRFPIMLLAILFGWLFFKWVRSLYGDKVALLALFFFSFSPTFIAHSRYVTTDLAAAFGFFIGLAAFTNFLAKQGTPQARKSLIIAGIAFGVAQLLKFSLVLLGPLYIILGVLWVFLGLYGNFGWKKFLKENLALFSKIFLIWLIGLVIIWIVYIPHVWKYPVEKQVADADFILTSFGLGASRGLIDKACGIFAPEGVSEHSASVIKGRDKNFCEKFFYYANGRRLAEFTVWLSGIPVLRAIGQYMLGLLMVIQRASGGNTTFFMGEISAAGWRDYFPVLYLLKEHLAFHILSLIALFFGLKNVLRSQEKNLRTLFAWLKDNFALTTSFVFIIIYWAQAVTSPLNIGVRHVLPTFPFIYLLVSRQTVRWVKDHSLDISTISFDQLKDCLKTLCRAYLKPAKKSLFVLLLLLWMFLAILVNFPHYLSYYNELALIKGGGYKIATDSNYDWGQDLKRLRDFVEQMGIEKIAIDYFGGGNPQYYFGDKFIPWWSAKGSPADETEWFAISLTFLQGARAKPVKNFHQKPEDTYSWLEDKEPVAKAGTSIFIYRF